MRSNLRPDSNRQFLGLRAVKEKRVSPTVINVVSGLPAGRGMHVQDNVKPFFPGPVDDPIQKFIADSLKPSAVGVVRHEQTTVEGDANRVKASLPNEFN